MSIDVVPAGITNGASSDAPSSSLLERLRRQSQAQQRERTLELEIGGAFDPPLVARYGVLPVHELERYAELAQNGKISNVEVMLDVMVRTNSAILARDGDELVTLEDEHGPVTYGHRLAVLLGMPIPPDETNLPPRETVLLLFGGNGMALMAHAGELMSWMQAPGGPAPGEASAETA